MAAIKSECTIWIEGAGILDTLSSLLSVLQDERKKIERLVAELRKLEAK